jgi:hypothetical protein
MHVRRHVPLLKIVPLDAVLAKLGMAKPQLIFAHVVHFVAPLAVGRSAADDKAHRRNLDTTRGLGVNSSL